VSARRVVLGALGLAVVLIVGAGAWVLSILASLAPPEAVVRTVSEATRRTLAQGELVGFEGRYGDFGWQGIPFAAPPVGELRWRAPQVVAAWSGTREAIAPGSACVQTSSPVQSLPGKSVGEIGGSEDCLTLNVHSPPFAAGEVPRGDARLPVMVWIHGGSNTHGSGGRRDGGHLAVAGDVVVVTLNYRLGPFGWFAHEALRAGAQSPEDASGNYGTLDLIAALGWVRDNITVFGGDPQRVTIFGESAGGADVISLLVSPLAEGLFHAAIVQSGGTRSFEVEMAENYADDLDVAGVENSAKEIVVRLLESGGAVTPEDAREQADSMSAAELAAYLRASSAEAVLVAYLTPGSWGYSHPSLLRDGVVLPDGDLLARLADPASHHAVPTIFGTNRDEAKLFLLTDPELVENRFGFMFRFADEVRHEWISEYRSALWKLQGADAPASVLSSASEQPVFVYRFDWDEERSIFGSDLSALIGAAHGLEIEYVFGDFRSPNLYDSTTEDSRGELSDSMMSYWAEFAHSGDPGRGRAGTLPRWKRWDSPAGNEEFIVFDTPADGGIRHSAERVTGSGLIAAVAADERLALRDKCWTFAGLVLRSDVLAEDAYGLAGGVDCSSYPLADFPWDAPAVSAHSADAEAH
jgi:para-nitrobenzyl esterase